MKIPWIPVWSLLVLDYSGDFLHLIPANPETVEAFANNLNDRKICLFLNDSRLIRDITASQMVSNKSIMVIPEKHDFNTSSKLCSSIGGKLAERPLITTHLNCIGRFMSERGRQTIRFWTGKDYACVKPRLKFCYMKLREEDKWSIKVTFRPERSSKEYFSLCAVAFKDPSVEKEEKHGNNYICSWKSTKVLRSPAGTLSRSNIENTTTDFTPAKTDTPIMLLGGSAQTESLSEDLIDKTNDYITVSAVVFSFLLGICAAFLIISMYKFIRRKKRKIKLKTVPNNPEPIAISVSTTDLDPNNVQEDSIYSEIREHGQYINSEHLDPLSKIEDDKCDKGVNSMEETTQDFGDEIPRSLNDESFDDMTKVAGDNQTDDNYDHLLTNRILPDGNALSHYSMGHDKTYSGNSGRNHLLDSYTDYDYADFMCNVTNKI